MDKEKYNFVLRRINNELLYWIDFLFWWIQINIINTACLEDVRHIICLYQFSPKNTGESKIEQPHEIAEITAVTGAQTPNPFQPGKCSFLYPAAKRFPVLFPCFFPSAADMLLESINIDFFVDSWMIISFVQTEVANISHQKPCSYFTGIFQDHSDQATVMDVGSCWRYPQGILWPSTCKRILLPLRPLSDGLRPKPSVVDFLRAHRGLQQRAVRGLPPGINTDSLLVFRKEYAKNFRHDAGLAPAVKVLMDSAFWSIARGKHSPLASTPAFVRLPARSVRCESGLLPLLFRLKGARSSPIRPHRSSGPSRKSGCFMTRAYHAFQSQKTCRISSYWLWLSLSMVMFC